MGSQLHYQRSCPLFIFGSSGLPAELPTELPPVSIHVYGSSGQPNLHGEIPMGRPWAAHSELPTFFIFGSSWLPTELPTELPTVSIYGSSGQPNLHGKISMGSEVGSPLRCPRAAHWQRSGQLPCFSVWEPMCCTWAAHWSSGQLSGQELPTVYVNSL